MAWNPVLRVEDLLLLDLSDLRRIWNDLPWQYQAALVGHRRAPPLLLWHAVKTSRDWAWRIGWVRDDIPPDLMWDLFLFNASTQGKINGHLVRHPSLTSEMLLVLTEIGDTGVRCNLLDHRNVTDGVLERLSHDPHRDIRREAAKRLRARRVLRSMFERSSR